MSVTWSWTTATHVPNALILKLDLSANAAKASGEMGGSAEVSTLLSQLCAHPRWHHDSATPSTILYASVQTSMSVLRGLTTVTDGNTSGSLAEASATTGGEYVPILSEDSRAPVTQASNSHLELSAVVNNSGLMVQLHTLVLYLNHLRHWRVWKKRSQWLWFQRRVPQPTGHILLHLQEGVCGWWHPLLRGQAVLQRCRWAAGKHFPAIHHDLCCPHRDRTEPILASAAEKVQEEIKKNKDQ